MDFLKSLEEKKTFESFFKLGQIFEEKKNYLKALEFYEKAGNFKPDTQRMENYIARVSIEIFNSTKDSNILINAHKWIISSRIWTCHFSEETLKLLFSITHQRYSTPDNLLISDAEYILNCKEVYADMDFVILLLNLIVLNGGK